MGKEGHAYTGSHQKRIESEQDRANAWVKVGHVQENLCLARSYSLHLSNFRGYEGTGLMEGNKPLIYAYKRYRNKPLHISFLNLHLSAITKVM